MRNIPVKDTFRVRRLQPRDGDAWDAPRPTDNADQLAAMKANRFRLSTYGSTGCSWQIFAVTGMALRFPSVLLIVKNTPCHSDKHFWPPYCLSAGLRRTSELDFASAMEAKNSARALKRMVVCVLACDWDCRFNEKPRGKSRRLVYQSIISHGWLKVTACMKNVLRPFPCLSLAWRICGIAGLLEALFTWHIFELVLLGDCRSNGVRVLGS